MLGLLECGDALLVLATHAPSGRALGKFLGAPTLRGALGRGRCRGLGGRKTGWADYPLPLPERLATTATGVEGGDVTLEQGSTGETCVPAVGALAASSRAFILAAENSQFTGLD